VGTGVRREVDTPGATSGCATPVCSGFPSEVSALARKKADEGLGQVDDGVREEVHRMVACNNEPGRSTDSHSARADSRTADRRRRRSRTGALTLLCVHRSTQWIRVGHVEVRGSGSFSFRSWLARACARADISAAVPTRARPAALELSLHPVPSALCPFGSSGPRPEASILILSVVLVAVVGAVHLVDSFADGENPNGGCRPCAQH